MANPGFGLIGTGFMGRAHAIALRSVATVFPDIEAPRLVCVADQAEAQAAAAARALQFERGTGDWRTLLDDPAIDVIDICTPNHLHYPMARAALEAGKHVYCEKPLALDDDEAGELAALAAASGVVHAVGLNYPTNPLLRTARELLASGELGEPVHFTGRYFEDYMADPAVPYSWRCERALAGSGALADLGSHLINLLHFLLGVPRRVLGETLTIVPARRDPATGTVRRVENEDIARAFMELENGLPASIEVSRVATGYKCHLAFDVFCSRGSLAFDQERMNELRLYEANQAPGKAGYKTLLAGPQHPDYAGFCPAPGHGLGINDLKVMELRNLVRAIAGDAPFQPDFAEGARVQRIMTAIERSGKAGGWIDVDLRAAAPAGNEE